MFLLWFLPAVLLNAVIGSAVLVALDTPDQVFFKWYKTDPFWGLGCFLILTLWPVMALMMICYKEK